MNIASQHQLSKLMLIRIFLAAFIGTFVGSVTGIVVVASIAGGLIGVGMALLLVLAAPGVFGLGCLLAAPVTVIALPVAAFIHWNNGDRFRRLYVFGLLTGAATGIIEAFLLQFLSPWSQWQWPPFLAVVSAAIIAGLVCGWIFQVITFNAVR